MTDIMSLIIKCTGSLFFLLLLSMSQGNLLAWVSQTNMHKALLEMFHHNNTKITSPGSAEECTRGFWAPWIPFPALREGQQTEADWWEPVLQVLRIHKLEGWTVRGEGLLDHAWKKFKSLLRHTYHAKDVKLTENKKRNKQLKIAPSSKIFSGFSWSWFLVLVGIYIWKVRP